MTTPLFVKKPLRLALQEADHWLEVGGPYSVGTTYKAVYGQLAKPEHVDEYTSQEFRDIDKRFPPVLDCLFAAVDVSLQAHYMHTVTGFWFNKSLYFPAEAFAEDGSNPHHRIEAVTQFYVPDNPDVVEVKYLHYVVSNTACGTEFSRSSSTAKARLKRSWMDAELPGWLERFNVALGLGLDPMAAADQVFYGGPLLPAPEAVVLNFDVEDLSTPSEPSLLNLVS